MSFLVNRFCFWFLSDFYLVLVFGVDQLGDRSGYDYIGLMLHKVTLTCFKCLLTQKIPLKRGIFMIKQPKVFVFTPGVRCSMSNDCYLTIQMPSTPHVIILSKTFLL